MAREHVRLLALMPVMVMITTALVAAACYGTGAAVQQRQAAAAPQSSAGRLRLLALLARQPLWLAGVAVQIGGFAAHAVALRSGPLAAVQMIVSAELVISIVVIRLWSRRPLSRASWAAALTVVAAIVIFLAATSPGHAAKQHSPALAAVLTGAAALAVAAAGLRASRFRRAILLAVAAGLADSCSAVVTMAFSQVVGHGPAALATSWTGYALVGCGLGNVLLTQSAYQTARPTLTLPVIAVVTPLASVAAGAGLLGETSSTSVAGAVAAGLAVLVAVVSLGYLARTAPELSVTERSTGPARPAADLAAELVRVPERV